jgi:CRP/FNR family cyclic AMP-dependent transcriptional regulator
MISPETLRFYPIFAELSDEHLRQIASITYKKAYQPGDWIMMEGDPADDLYIILTGQVNVHINVDTAGERRVDMTTVREGELIGWASLFTDTRGASVEARSEVTLAEIDGPALRDLMDTDHTLGYHIMERVALIIYEHLYYTNIQLISLT